MAPTAKRRKLNRLEEVTFDPAARQEYLTGFHKRKQQRKQDARDVAMKREKEERVKERRQIREQRKEDLATHLAEFNAELRKLNPDMSDAESTEDDDDANQHGGMKEWSGLEDTVQQLEQDEEYVDEDKYTTVTVEAMDLAKGQVESAELLDEGKAKSNETASHRTHKAALVKKASAAVRPKKKKFRYESKAERQTTRQKQKMKNRAAKARRTGK